MNIPLEVSDDPDRIRSAEKLVLPGVGAFADAMSNLQAKTSSRPSAKASGSGTPLLGLCLGLQLLFSESEEFGRTEGFRFHTRQG